MAVQNQQRTEPDRSFVPGIEDPGAGTSGEGSRARHLLTRGIFIVALLGATALFVYPLIWLLAASLKPPAEIFNSSLIGSEIRWDNYTRLFDMAPILRWTWNSILVTFLAATAVTISSALVGWAFAYFRFPHRNKVFALVLATMMLPGAVLMIPQFLIWDFLGFNNTLYPLWAGRLFGSAFYIFLQRQFFLGLPRELFEAARVDGASYLGLFTRIAMPLAVPSFIIVFLFEFQSSWNNLQAGLIYLNAGTVEGFTVPLGIAHAMTKYSPTNGGQGDYQYVMVASLLVMLPMLLLFAFGQRYFIEGVATQGRKG